MMVMSILKEMNLLLAGDKIINGIAVLIRLRTFHA